MKKKKQRNNFDALVERLVQEFIKIPNFDLTRTDKVANKMFNIITLRIAEIISYKELVCHHFIPATNKAIFDARKDFQSSSYKTLLNTNDLDFQETLYDTIRLAYVGLFHKLENYINEVIKVPDLVFGELYETEGNVNRWAKDKFQFDIKDWQQFYITHKINWICNCVKHKDGFPTKIPKPVRFKNADESQKIRISPDEFKNDCDLLIRFYPIYLQVTLLFAQHKLVTEKLLIKENWKDSPELYEKQIETLKKMESSINSIVDILKME